MTDAEEFIGMIKDCLNECVVIRYDNPATFIIGDLKIEYFDPKWFKISTHGLTVFGAYLYSSHPAFGDVCVDINGLGFSLLGKISPEVYGNVTGFVKIEKNTFRAEVE